VSSQTSCLRQDSPFLVSRYEAASLNHRAEVSGPLFAAPHLSVRILYKFVIINVVLLDAIAGFSGFPPANFLCRRVEAKFGTETCAQVALWTVFGLRGSCIGTFKFLICRIGRKVPAIKVAPITTLIQRLCFRRSRDGLAGSSASRLASSLI
jgi:hypothetical protein